MRVNNRRIEAVMEAVEQVKEAEAILQAAKVRLDGLIDAKSTEPFKPAREKAEIKAPKRVTRRSSTSGRERLAQRAQEYGEGTDARRVADFFLQAPVGAAFSIKEIYTALKGHPHAIAGRVSTMRQEGLVERLTRPGFSFGVWAIAGENANPEPAVQAKKVKKVTVAKSAPRPGRPVSDYARMLPPGVTRTLLLTLLDNPTRRISKPELAKQTKLNPNSIGPRLTELKQKGYVERTDEGWKLSQ